jgi:hypothetical protein
LNSSGDLQPAVVLPLFFENVHGDISHHANGLLECSAELFEFVFVPFVPATFMTRGLRGERVGMLDMVQVTPDCTNGSYPIDGGLPLRSSKR